MSSNLRLRSSISLRYHSINASVSTISFFVAFSYAEETNTISDLSTTTWIYAPYLDHLFPLRKLECAGRLADGQNLGHITQITDILALPNKEGYSILVNLEIGTVYGHWTTSSSVKTQEQIHSVNITFCPWRSSRLG